MRDLPTGPALLALARDVLLRDLMALLPQEAHLEARLVANSMAIAEREAMAGEEPAQEILRELEKLYREGPHPNPPPQRAGGGDPLSGGVGAETMDPLARLARDLRAGAFESSEPREHHARRILWRLIIAKLRSANPRFLNANGFS